MVVVGVDFRNAYTSAGMNPFPAGLNVCGSAASLDHAHPVALGIRENDGYFINGEGMDLHVAAFDPAGVNSENPLCWPYFATGETSAISHRIGSW